MLWYNSFDSVKAIREGQHETTTGSGRLMRLIRSGEPVGE